VEVILNPPDQYADDRNLRARQRFWQRQDPYFDDVEWVLGLAGLSPGMRVLDAGCGNGVYLRGLRDCRVTGVGCDLSMGMLRAVTHPALLNADVAALRPATHAFTAENPAAQLGAAFETVTCIRPPSTSPVVIRDATVAADYVASLDAFAPLINSVVAPARLAGVRPRERVTHRKARELHQTGEV
jgi:SAM-dependent methyltransferase